MKYVLQNPIEFSLTRAEIIGNFLYWTNKYGTTRNGYCKTLDKGKRLFYRTFGKGAKWKLDTIYILPKEIDRTPRHDDTPF